MSVLIASMLRSFFVIRGKKSAIHRGADNKWKGLAGFSLLRVLEFQKKFQLAFHIKKVVWWRQSFSSVASTKVQHHTDQKTVEDSKEQTVQMTDKFPSRGCGK